MTPSTTEPVRNVAPVTARNGPIVQDNEATA